MVRWSGGPAGRGALDVKVGVVGLLEGAMALINEGYEPKRTLIMAFGQDEESSGFAGAAQIAGQCFGAGQQTPVWDAVAYQAWQGESQPEQQ